jgi:RNA polymerase sigma-70 factor (family 1)
MQRPLFNLTDAELTQKFNTGSEAAFAEIYKRYWLQMFNHARRLLKDREMARDAVQEVFTKLWEKRKTLEVKGSLAGFVYQGIRNHIINLIAHEKVKNTYMERLAHFQVDSSWNTDELIRAKELAKLFETEIGKLPDKMKTTFILSRDENLSHREIALRTGTSEGTVKKQIYYALKILRGKISVLFTFIIG